MTALAGELTAAPSAPAREMLTADVAIVGAGPAGIAAAVRAAEAGQRVIVLDSSSNAGGQIWRHRTRRGVEGEARRWLDRLARTGAQVRHGLSVVDAMASGSDGGITLVAERHLGGAVVGVRARSLVIATGARERFLPFPGWTLGGVMGIGGAQALLKQGTSFRGKRVVIAGTGPLMLPVAASLSRAGARLELVAEQARPGAVRAFALSLVRHPETLVQAAMYRLAFFRTSYVAGTWVTEAVGDAEGHVRHVVVTNGRRSRTVPCEVLCTGYGLVPNLEMARLLGCATADGTVVVDDRQETTVPGVFAAGEATGVGGVAVALVEGEIAGAAAAGVGGVDPTLVRRRAGLRDMAAALDRAFALRPELRTLARADTIVCRCEDVRSADLGSLRDSRQAKLYTRAGMGACQGRVCGAALEFLYGWPRDSVRPPLEPSRVSTLGVAAWIAAGVAADATTPANTSISSSGA